MSEALLESMQAERRWIMKLLSALQTGDSQWAEDELIKRSEELTSNMVDLLAIK